MAFECGKRIAALIINSRRLAKAVYEIALRNYHLTRPLTRTHSRSLHSLQMRRLRLVLAGSSRNSDGTS